MSDLDDTPAVHEKWATVSLDHSRATMWYLHGRNVPFESQLESIRRQRVTQVFYLPQCSGLGQESIVFLDRVQSFPNDLIERRQISESRLFSLSNYGLYLYVYKLSMHFTRLNEGAGRAA
jgi:hypothetical protein